MYGSCEALLRTSYVPLDVFFYCREVTRTLDFPALRHSVAAKETTSLQHRHRIFFLFTRPGEKATQPLWMPIRDGQIRLVRAFSLYRAATIHGRCPLAESSWLCRCYCSFRASIRSSLVSVPSRVLCALPVPLPVNNRGWIIGALGGNPVFPVNSMCHVAIFVGKYKHALPQH